MGTVARFTPAGAYRNWDAEVAAAIRELPSVRVKKARRITAADMELALAELSRLHPEWRAEREDTATWQVTLQRTETIRGKRDVTQEMAMWADGLEAPVDIGGFDDTVILVIGQYLADRAGPQVFEHDAGTDAILFTPRPGAKLQPAPKAPAQPRRVTAKAASITARVAPLDVLVDDLDPLARAAWHRLDDDIVTRPVTVADITAALRAEAKAHPSWKLRVRGAGADWRATLARTRGPAMELAIDRDTNQIVIHADPEDPIVTALGHRLAEMAGPQGLVVGDEAVAIYVPERRR